MTTIMNHSELLRRALVFADEMHREKPDVSLDQVMDKAGERFNLSPMDSEALLHIFREAHARDLADKAASGSGSTPDRPLSSPTSRNP